MYVGEPPIVSPTTRGTDRRGPSRPFLSDKAASRLGKARYHCAMSGPSKREIIALGMLNRLSKATDGQPQQWRALDLIVQTPEQVKALQFAVKHGWVLVSPGAHSVCLTEKGMRLTGTR